ncbi:Lrp/AsnC family transcriptional regulator [Nakamurella leprariae]|uniref:AsnC family transcriptional regulator n=1 Tax=Nakamurella leprariae TaxID=2803911 RepID=A0A938YGL3_9ACTN|nr:winged helix-turn-helix transcriptional regulator [Nakamurella leprariae]MBM9469519.1 AsnC family transcriptional regulator [Nakamurella leprariae]
MDAVDHALLAQLRRNGRARQQELAAALGISRSAVAGRLRVLLDSGAVQVVGVVHPSVMGLHAVAHLSVRVSRPVTEVAAALARHDDTPFVSLISGSSDLVAEVRAPGPAELAVALERVRSTDGVAGVTTLTYSSLELDVLRPAPGSEKDVDAIDLMLLELLLDDGRMSLSEMSRRTGLSSGTVRSRTRRLLDEQIIKVGALASSEFGGASLAIGLGIQVSGRVRPVIDALAATPTTRFLATTTGRFDMLATVHAGTTLQGVQLVDAVRQFPQVASLESWVHLHVVKERYRPAPPGSGHLEASALRSDDEPVVGAAMVRALVREGEQT